MNKPAFFHTPLRVLLVGSNFCRKNEPRDAYGASCLVSAFRNSPANAGDTLDVFTSDLNRFQKANGDFDIDWGLAADEIVTRALIGGYNVVAFSVFGWCERMVVLAGTDFASVLRVSSSCLGEPPFSGARRGSAGASHSRTCSRSVTAKRYSRTCAAISTRESPT